MYSSLLAFGRLHERRVRPTDVLLRGRRLDLLESLSVRKRIGVMVPSTNTTVEADFQRVAPIETTTIHGQRLWLTNGANGNAAMSRMNSEIRKGARYLATAAVDVIAYGCTTG